MTGTCGVAVIGAGLSGLVAAHELVREGLDVVVLEARDRLGGRTHASQVGGVTVDLGGEWVDDAHADTKALVAGLGLRLVPAAQRKEEALWSIGGRSTSGMPLSDRDRNVYRRINEVLAETAGGVGTEAPWEGAPDRDGSVEAWLGAEGMTEEGQHTVETLLSTCGSTVPLESDVLLPLRREGGDPRRPRQGERVPGRGRGRSPRGLRKVSASGCVAPRRCQGSVRTAGSRCEVRESRGAPVPPGEEGGARAAVHALRGHPVRPAPADPLRGLASGDRYGVGRKMAFVYDGPVEALALAVTDTPSGYLWTVRGPVGETGVVSFSGGRSLGGEMRSPKEERERRAAALVRGLFGLREPGTVTEVAWSEDPWSWGSYLIARPGDTEALRRAGGGSWGRCRRLGVRRGGGGLRRCSRRGGCFCGLSWGRRFHWRTPGPRRRGRRG